MNCIGVLKPNARNSVPIFGSTIVCYAARKFAVFEFVLGMPVLAELRLENYAVIDNIVVEFSPGLNLLTGETGAGKSILIDALGLLLGEKASM